MIGSYWTSSGPYDEIFYYIEKNVDDVRDDLALMAAEEAVPGSGRVLAVGIGYDKGTKEHRCKVEAL